MTPDSAPKVKVPKPVATIPEDLRARNDLTIGTLQRVLEIRARRGQLETQQANAKARLAAIETEYAALGTEETTLLATKP